MARGVVGKRHAGQTPYEEDREQIHDERFVSPQPRQPPPPPDPDAEQILRETRITNRIRVDEAQTATQTEMIALPRATLATIGQMDATIPSVSGDQPTHRHPSRVDGPGQAICSAEAVMVADMGAADLRSQTAPPPHPLSPHRPARDTGRPISILLYRLTQGRAKRRADPVGATAIGREVKRCCAHNEVEVSSTASPRWSCYKIAPITRSAFARMGVAFAETFEALVGGIQGALWDLGGVPLVLRSDNLSAATHQLRRTGGRSLTERYRAVLEHYDLRSTRIQPGESHENGVAEQRHYRTKSALAQALLLRGSADFTSEEKYRTFVAGIIAKQNRQVEAALEEERKHLRALPSAAVPGYTIVRSKVRKWSTIRVGNKTYSVPSRLIGHDIVARLYPDTVEVYYHDERVLTMPRLHGEHEHRIDYRHVIWSLVKKPGAFARYRYREDLFPSLIFRRAYDSLLSRRGDRAEVEYVRILHLAASTMESLVEKTLEEFLAADAAFDYAQVKARCAPQTPAFPLIAIGLPDLSIYDSLLAMGAA